MAINKSRRGFLKVVGALTVAALPQILNTPNAEWFKLLPAKKMCGAEVANRMEEKYGRSPAVTVLDNKFIEQYQREVSRRLAENIDTSIMNAIEES